MLKRKNIRERGKRRLSDYFRNFKDGDKVAIIREHSMNPAFHKRIQGKTGVIVGKRGNAYIISLYEGNKQKIHIIKPANLKKLG